MESVPDRPLGSFETAQALTDAHTPFNVVAILRLRDGPDKSTIRQALDALQRRHPLLRAAFVSTIDGLRFVPCERPINLECTDRFDDSTWEGAAEAELGHRFDTEVGPLVRCQLISSRGDGPSSEVILNFHHSIIDGASGTNAAGELLGACALIEEGEKPEIGPPLPLLPPSESLFPTRHLGGRRRLRLAGFLMRQMADEISYRVRSIGTRRPPVHPSGLCRVLCCALEAEDTTALVRTCRRRRLSLNSALNAAMLLAVQRQLYEGKTTPMRHFNFANLRPLLKPPVTNEHIVGLHSMLRVTVVVRADSDLWSTADEVNRAVAGGARRGDFFSSAAMSATMMRIIIGQGKQRMGTTALAYAGPPKLPRTFGSTEVVGLEVFVSNLTLGPEFTAQARLVDGEIRWNIVYLDCDMDRTTAESVAEEMMSMLRNPWRGKGLE
jgi:hypothetical protein